jgi:hypothetical protein
MLNEKRSIGVVSKKKRLEVAATLYMLHTQADWQSEQDSMIS